MSGLSADLKIDLIGTCLTNDGVIAYPTEGVWGLGCLPDSRIAVDRILAMKERSWRQGLLVVAANREQIMGYVDDLSDIEIATLDEQWPGHVSFLLPHNGNFPRWIVGEHDTVGVRVSAHPTVQQLCEAFGPLVSTSANISGQPSAVSESEVQQYFGDRVDLIVPGELGGATGASTIKHLRDGTVLR